MPESIRAEGGDIVELKMVFQKTFDIGESRMGKPDICLGIPNVVPEAEEAFLRQRIFFLRFQKPSWNSNIFLEV